MGVKSFEEEILVGTRTGLEAVGGGEPLVDFGLLSGAVGLGGEGGHGSGGVGEGPNNGEGEDACGKQFDGVAVVVIWRG